MGNTPGGLPYHLGEPVSSYTDIQGWSLHAGTSKADKSPVSIFKYNPKSTNLNGNTTASAQNALKLAKTMKHPNVVRCLDGIETPAGEILIITEPVVPLLDWLTTTRAVETNQDTFANAVTLGLAGVVRALSFLNNDVSICHGLFSHHAVFVTSGGDWKVSRFDLAGKVDASFLDRHQLLNRSYQSPERSSNDRAVLRNMPLHAIDAWSLGVLIRTVYGGEVVRTEDLQNTSKIPKGLTQAYQKLLKGTPEKRLNINRLLSLKHLQDNALVKSMFFLDEIMIRTPEEKFYFFQSLTDQLDHFPLHVCKYRVLPALTSSLSLGATSGETSMGVAGPIVLVPLLKLGTMLNAEEYTTHITPVVLKMFEQQDRGIRVALLSSLPALVESIDSTLFNTKIFQHICTGFNDTAPQMRELTLKSLPILAPILETKVMDNQLKKVLKQSLQDPVPTIRTNATVCLGLLACKFPKSTIVELCLPCFTRALRDSFPHNRERALHSIKVTLDLYTNVDLGTKMMPHVCPSMIDPVYEVRNTAFSLFEVIQERLKAASETQEKEDAIKREEMKHQTSLGSDSVGVGGSSSSGGSSGYINKPKKNNSTGGSSTGGSSTGGSSTGGGNSYGSSNRGRNINLSTNSSNSAKKNKGAGGDDGFDFDTWDDGDGGDDGMASNSSSSSSSSSRKGKSMEQRKKEQEAKREERRKKLQKQRELKKLEKAGKNKTTKSSGKGMQLGGSGGRGSRGSSGSLRGMNIGGGGRKNNAAALPMTSSALRDEDSSMMDGWGGEDAGDDADFNDLLDFTDEDEEEQVVAPKQKKKSAKVKPPPATATESNSLVDLLDDGGGWGDMDDLDNLLSSPVKPKPVAAKPKPVAAKPKKKDDRPRKKSLAERKKEREQKQKEKTKKKTKKKIAADDDGWDDDGW